MARHKTIKVSAYTRQGVKVPAHNRVIADKPRSRLILEKPAQRGRFGGTEPRTVFHRSRTKQKQIKHSVFDPQQWKAF